MAESFIQSNVPEAQNESSLFAYDPSESEKLLTDAGWKVGAGGIRVKDGKQLTFNLIPNPYVPQTSQEDELVSQQLAKVGIKAPLKIIPLANYAEVEKPPIPPILSQSRSFADFSTVGGVLTSLNGGENWFGLGTTNKTLNSLSEQIESAPTTSQRNTYADQVQKYVLQQGLLHPAPEPRAARLRVWAQRARGDLQRHGVRQLLHGLAVVSSFAVGTDGPASAPPTHEGRPGGRPALPVAMPSAVSFRRWS